MKARRILPVMLVSFLLIGKAMAQPAIEMFCTSNKEYIAQAAERKWLVELVQEDPQILKLIGKKDLPALEKYKKSIASSNEALQKAVEKNWILAAEKPEFKSREEIAALTKAGQAEEYVFLSLNRFMLPQPEPKSKSSKPAPIKEEANVSIRLGGNSYRHLGAVNLPTSQPTEAEMVVALQLLQNHFLIRQNSASLTAFEDGIKQNADLLKDKTLLVPKQTIKKGMTVEMLKTVYPYEVRIVEQTEIEKAISGKDNSVCFVQTLPAYGGAKPVSMQLIINAADGKLLARSIPPITTKGVLKSEVKIEDFKEFMVYTTR